MDKQRRDLLVQGVQGLTFISLSSPFTSHARQRREQDTSYRGALPILQGMTNADSAQFTILGPKTIPMTYKIKNSYGLEVEHVLFQREIRTFSKWSIDKIFVGQLNPQENYTLLAYETATGKLIDQRFFKTVDLNRKQIRFAILSCMNDSFDEASTSMWDSLASVQPDYAFMVGDTCYSDNSNSRKDEKGYWQRYCDTRMGLGHFRQRRLTPTLAVWDDHDYGGNNATKDLPQRNITKELFDIFFGNLEVEGYKSTFGAGKVFQAAGQSFYFMDCRSFRDDKDTARGLHWGTEQQNWLMDDLNRSEKTAWLLNGSQFFGGYLGKDSFESSHRENFREMVRELSRVQSKVAFVSGDVHFSEVMKIEQDQIGYETFEVTSSSMHSFTFPLHQFRKRNPRRIESTSSHNFVVVTAEVKDNGELNFTAESFGKGANSRFKTQGLVSR